MRQIFGIHGIRQLPRIAGTFAFVCGGVLATTGCAGALAPLADEATPPAAASVDKPRVTVPLDPNRVRIEVRVTTITTHTLHVPVASASWSAPRGHLDESRVQIELALDGLTSAPQKLADIAMSPNFLDTVVFPRGHIDGRWLRSRAEPDDGAPHELFFDLVLKNRRRGLKAPATLKQVGCELRMETVFAFDRHSFGIESSGGYEKLVGREIEVNLEASVEAAPFGVPCAPPA